MQRTKRKLWIEVGAGGLKTVWVVGLSRHTVSNAHHGHRKTVSLFFSGVGELLVQDRPSARLAPFWASPGGWRNLGVRSSLIWGF